MHTPSAFAARPVPKRTRSTAGLEEADAWLGSMSSATSSGPSPTHALMTATAALEEPAGVGRAFDAHGTSRKRHHSLPSTTIAGSLLLPVSSASTKPSAHFDLNSASRRAPPPSGTRRPELAVVAHCETRYHSVSPSSSKPSRRHSNQYSPSLHQPGPQFNTASYSPLHLSSSSASSSPAAPSLAASLHAPEMSPREDFLVRAFVSDAMNLESGDDALELQSRGSLVRAEDATNATVATTPTASSGSQSHHKWTRGEDEKLRDAVSRFGGKSWKLIAEMLGNGRTDVQCLHRWNKVLKPGLVKGPWTPEEDRILLNLISRYGVGQIRWCDVALHLPGRIGKQCRERWCNHLDSSIRKGQWTPQEDDTVFRLQQTIGNKWSEIAKKLPGRTENAVKNRFNSAARRKWIINQAGGGEGDGINVAASAASGKLPRQSHRSLPQQQQQQHDVTFTNHLASLPNSAVPHASSTAIGPVKGRELLSTGLLAGPPRPPVMQFHRPPPPASLFTGSSHGASPESSSFALLNDPGRFRDHDHAQSLYSFTDEQAAPSNAILAQQTTSYATSQSHHPRPTFSFHPGNAFNPPHVSTATPSLASLTTLLLGSPSPSLSVKPEEPELSFRDDERDDPLTALSIGDDNQDGGGGSGCSDNQETGSSPLSPHFSTKRLSIANQRGDKCRLSEPHVDTDVDLNADDEYSLRAIEIPNSEHDADGGQGSSPVDMDDQNMSTFLDSVALELDDML